LLLPYYVFDNSHLNVDLFNFVGASCSGITDPIANMEYMPTEDIGTFATCQPEDSCLSKVSSGLTEIPRTSYYYVSAKAANGSDTKIDFCNEGYYGDYCQICKPNYYRQDRKCISCASGDAKYTVIALSSNPSALFLCFLCRGCLNSLYSIKFL
jgi:hypothetical protein